MRVPAVRPGRQPVDAISTAIAGSLINAAVCNGVGKERRLLFSNWLVISSMVAESITRGISTVVGWCGVKRLTRIIPGKTDPTHKTAANSENKGSAREK